mmetsp:Transcript_13125/g.37449  ORF Transcript_13125/g.37449 Transcript_13125/m.37449 type:complete len:222 (-) Transcript_13125:138-803(-)
MALASLMPRAAAAAAPRRLARAVLGELKASPPARASSSSSSHSGAGAGGGAGEEHGDGADGPDLYSVLGLPRGSSPEEIKAAYRRIAKECHPDASPGDPVAAARFREVSNAHSTLLHVGLRRMYDLHLQRREAQERCEQEEQQTRGPRALATAGTALASLSALLVGTCAWALDSPGFFWTCFRGVPDWLPGKWRLAEFYTLHAARRQEAGGTTYRSGEAVS